MYEQNERWKRRESLVQFVRAPKSKFYDCCSSYFDHHFHVRSIKISISTSRRNGQHLFRACRVFLSGRFFVWNRYKNEMRDVRLYSGRFFLPNGFLAWFKAIEDLLLGPQNATFMMVNQQTTKSIMKAKRREVEKKHRHTSDLFYLCGFTTIASAQFFSLCFQERQFRWFDAIISSSLWINMCFSVCIYRITHTQTKTVKSAWMRMRGSQSHIKYNIKLLILTHIL